MVTREGKKNEGKWEREKEKLNDEIWKVVKGSHEVLSM